MKRSAAIILTVATISILSQASKIDVATYEYDTTEDYVKLGAGAIAGISTALSLSNQIMPASRVPSLPVTPFLSIPILQPSYQDKQLSTGLSGEA